MIPGKLRILCALIAISLLYNLIISIYVFEIRGTPFSPTLMEPGQDRSVALKKHSLPDSALSVLHVTREHASLATLGGVGPVVHSLSHWYLQLGYSSHVALVIPFYTLIAKKLQTSPCMQVQVPFKTQTLTVQIHEARLPNGVHVFLVERPHDSQLFSELFTANVSRDIYKLPESLTYEHRDALFSIAVGQLVVQIGGKNHRCSWKRPIDLLHIHGATNALVLPYVHNMFGKQNRPTFVYTLHDYVYVLFFLG